MIKYTSTQVCFREIPDEISLCINISNCPYKCKGCHSPYLQMDCGEILNQDELHKLIERNKGVTCVCFMGRGQDMETINKLALFVKSNGLKVGLYMGDNQIPEEINLLYFNYIKVGPYIQELGALDSPTTNQRMYEIVDGQPVDITKKFWK